jgi:hypothetical protein
MCLCAQSVHGEAHGFLGSGEKPGVAAFGSDEPWRGGPGGNSYATIRSFTINDIPEVQARLDITFSVSTNIINKRVLGLIDDVQESSHRICWAVTGVRLGRLNGFKALCGPLLYACGLLFPVVHQRGSSADVRGASVARLPCDMHLGLQETPPWVMGRNRHSATNLPNHSQIPRLLSHIVLFAKGELSVRESWRVHSLRAKPLRPRC